MTTEYSQQYREYLDSPEWQEKRATALERAEWACERGGCGQMAFHDDWGYVPLHVHHLTYKRLGDELPSDLMVLCETHHKEQHRRQRKERDQVRWQSRVAGWARLRHGEFWLDRLDFEDVEDEFRDWLEDAA